MSSEQVSVIIVNYQVRDLLHRCLFSVAAQRGVEVETWVVDNASSDGSADMVAAEFPAVRLIRNAANVGFATANNQALAPAGGDVLLLLNPDTELPDGALAELVRVFKRHPSAGCVGFSLVDGAGAPQPWCHALPGVLNQAAEALGVHKLLFPLGYGTPTQAPLPRSGEGPVDWVSGACFAISRRAYAAVGGLNQELFLYGEEPDWCWRARRAGFATMGSSAMKVIHHGGASSEGAHGPLFVKNLEARLAFMRNHRSAFATALAREVITVGALLRLTYWQLRAWLERNRRAARTRIQLDRFRAVVAWRFGGSR